MFNFTKLIYAMGAFYLCWSPQCFAVQAADVLAEKENGMTINETFVRKGSIAATMLNAREFDRIKSAIDIPNKKEQLDLLFQDIHSLTPSLEALDLFKFFRPIEWLSENSGKEGRALIAVIYLQHYPQKIDQEILERLKELSGQASEELKSQILKISQK